MIHRTMGLVLVAVAFMLALFFGCAAAASVRLEFTTVGDDSLSGTASQYDLRRSTVPITAGNFLSAVRCTTPLPLVAGSTQSVTVHGLSPDTTYYFAIKTADEGPRWAPISNVVAATPPESLPPPLPPQPPRPVTDLAVGTVSGPAAAETHAWVRWGWTVKDSVIGWQARSLDGSGNPWTPTLREEASLSSGPPVPDLPGHPDHAWVHWPRAVSPATLSWLIGVNRHGLRSDSSNAVAIRLGVPRDTSAYDVCGGTWTTTRLLGVTGAACFSRAWGRNEWTKPSGLPWSAVPLIATQEELQAADRDELCREFNTWALRGVQQLCDAPSHWWQIWEWFR